jgi:hypothetical protein
MLFCMRRTTLAIDDNLFRDLKARAAREGIPLGKLVNDLLQQAQTLAKRPRHKVKWLTFRGMGVLPGVDLDDRKSLYDLMDPPGKWLPKP